MATSVFGTTAYGGVTLTDGLDLTTTNSGASQINKISGSVKWKATTAFGGAFAVECISGTNNAADGRFPLAASSKLVSVYMDFICPPLPTTSSPLTLLSIRNTVPTPVILYTVNQNGKIQVMVGSVTQEAFFPQVSVTGHPADPSPTAVLVAGSKYRLEVQADVTAGTLKARIYAYGADVNTFLGQINATGVALGSADFNLVDAGPHALAEGGRTVQWSNLRVVDGVNAWGGPYVPGAAPLAAGLTLTPTSGNTPLTVTATASKTGGAGTTFTYAFDWGDGTSTSAQSSNVATHIYATAGTFTVTATVNAT